MADTDTFLTHLTLHEEVDAGEEENELQRQRVGTARGDGRRGIEDNFEISNSRGKT